MKYRLYIDEVGNSDIASSRDPNNQFLSLTGLIFEVEYAKTVLFPSMETLKRRHFNHTTETPVILHRKDIVNKRGSFKCLKDAEKERLFNEELLSLIESLDFTVITVVIDKAAHLNKYAVWRYEPYHYSMMVTIERFVHWLEAKNAQGDVMAESRGGGHDVRLKDSFERLTRKGSEYVKTSSFNKCLTSRQLKMCSKTKNIPGVQLADLLAHPSYCKVLDMRNGNYAYRPNFGGKVAQILEASKYYRRADGRVEGFGRKWLP